MTEAAERAAVVAAARSWIGTPYFHRGRIKGVAVDCASLILEAFSGAGLVPDQELPPYSPQWNLNRDAQDYLAVIFKHAKEIAPPPGPGDLVLWKVGRTFSHGAIVTEWPRVVHALIGRMCYEEDISGAEWLTKNKGGDPRPVKYLSYWA